MEFLNGRIEAIRADITEQHTDAIVNAANSSLMGGGGVDGAIHSRGGPAILEECRKIRSSLYPGGLPAGLAVSTGAGRLHAKWIIHTVGPVWHGGRSGEETILKNAYINSLQEAIRLGCKTISFPAISTGVYSFPPEKAAAAVSEALRDFITAHDTDIKIYLVFFSSRDYDIFVKYQNF